MRIFLMEEIIELHKCVDAERFLEILDESIETLAYLRETVRQEIFYDELS